MIGEGEEKSKSGSAVFDAAMGLLRLGFSIIPYRVDGSKVPAVTWKKYRTTPPTEETLSKWFGGEDPYAIGIVGGFNNFIAFDFETVEEFEKWKLLVEPILADFGIEWSTLPIVESPRPGRHAYFLCDTLPPSAEVLAVDKPLPESDDDKPNILIETRGDGFCVIAPGSPAATHPSGKPYTWLQQGWIADPSKCKRLNADILNLLLNAGRSLNRYVKPNRIIDTKGKRKPTADGNESRPGDDYNKRGPEWKDLLEPHGWYAAHRSGDAIFWRRPGKTNGWSATTGYCKNEKDDDLFYVFTGNANPFEQGRCYSKFAVYAFLQHGGSFREATRQLGFQGFGEQKKPGQKLSDSQREEFRDALNADETTTDAKEEASKLRISPSGYAVYRGHIVIVEFTEVADKDDKSKLIKEPVGYHPLCNFASNIKSEIITDDGAEREHSFEIEVSKPGRPAKSVVVPSDRYTSMDWIISECGPSYVVGAGKGKQDHLRAAIQELSNENIPTTVVYRHTGWRQIDGQWCYLHGGGAIGSNGPVENVRVQLDGAAAKYVLSNPPAGDDLKTAIRATLGILNGLTSDLVAFPLIATTFRAAIGCSVDCSLWMAGQTGAQKSELVALSQQHYGAGMVRNALPGNWSSTDNALEGLAFTIKDAVLVIDDFAPSTNRHDADRQHKVAERLIRGQGNSSGRQRMTANATLRPPKPPRGFITATGEDVPHGHSITARLGIVDVDRGSVNLPRLSQCQRDAVEGRYASTMSGFVHWLAKEYDSIRQRIETERIALRDELVNKYAHARTPDVAANLLIGLCYFLQFAIESGAINQRQHDDLLVRGKKAIQGLGERQGEYQNAVDPVARFPEMLSSIISSGRGHIAGDDGREPGLPPLPRFWGWEGREYRAGVSEGGTSYSGLGEKIGWVVGNELYLDRDATFAALTKLANNQGMAFPVGKDTLFKRLKDAKMLIDCDKDKTFTRRTLEGARKTVSIFHADKVLSLSQEQWQQWQQGQEGNSNQKPSEDAATVPATVFESSSGSSGSKRCDRDNDPSR